MKRKIIIDTDPGVDDALAIIFALNHPDIEVLGITTVGGNKGLETTTNNATRVVKHFTDKFEPIVYKGKETPYSEHVDEQFNRNINYQKETIHGKDGLGQSSLVPSDKLVSEQDAISFIIETIEKYPDEVDIITLGPLTNIAYCIEENEEAMKKVKSIHSMGGGIKRGNRTPVAEFNYWFDPHAVNKVFELGQYKPIHMIGLDLTHQVILDMNELTFIRLAGGEMGEIIYSILSDYIDFHWNFHRILGTVMHDLTAMVGYIHPEIYTQVSHASMQCVVDNSPASGQTIVDLENRWGNEKNAYIPLGVNIALYKSIVIKTLFNEEVSDEFQKYF